MSLEINTIERQREKKGQLAQDVKDDVTLASKSQGRKRINYQEG